MENKRKSEYINRNMFWMAIGLLVVFFIYVFCITFLDIPKEKQKYVDIVLGFLSGTTVSNIIGYYYGTSNSNGQKDKNLDDLMELHKGAMIGPKVEAITDTVKDIKDNLVQGNFKEVKDKVIEGIDQAKDLFDPKDIPPPLDPDAE